MHLAASKLVVLSILLSLAAFILSLICVLAGTKPGSLENVNLLTLNTSMLGHIDVDISSLKESVFRRGFGDLMDKAEGAIEDGIEGGIGVVADKVAEALNIHDFYSAHILTYCDGYYTPSPLSNETTHPAKNVTYCSYPTSSFHFDPASIIQSELGSGISLKDIQWPDAVDDGMRAIKTASKVMLVLYCIGIATTGLAFMSACSAIAFSGLLGIAVNGMLSMLGLAVLAIASAISTIVVFKAVGVINKYGNDIGLEAYKGNTFLGMTWAATVLIFLVSCLWGFEFIRCRRAQTTNGEKGLG